jgi:uncharacterized membrane protein YbjE (DUF340 family)
VELIAILSGGFVLGWLLRKRTRLLGGLNRAAGWVIYALLFVVGLSLGLDEHTMSNLGSIGLTSLGYALLTIALSMAGVALVLPLLGRRHPTGEREQR